MLTESTLKGYMSSFVFVVDFYYMFFMFWILYYMSWFISIVLS